MLYLVTHSFIPLFIFIPNHLKLQYRRNKKSHLRPSLPEIKLLFLFCYYFLLGTVSLPAMTLSSSNAAKFNSSLYEYFDCEYAGLPNNCTKSVYTEYTNPELRSIGIVVYSLIPAVHLVYVINWTKAKQMLLRSLENLARNLRLQKVCNTRVPPDMV